MTNEERNKKVEENLGLITFCLNKLGVGYNEDYFQQGVLELIRCVENYDTNKKKEFSTYAINNIKWYLKEYIIRDRTIKPKRCGQSGRVKGPQCDSLNKVVYNNGTDGEITLEDTIIGNNFLDDLEIKMELELAVEKELISQKEIDIVMDIKVYKIRKRELTKKYELTLRQLNYTCDQAIKKLKDILSYNN